MKKILSIIVLTFAISTAVRADLVWPGAWYLTGAPTPGEKQGGGFEVYFFDDNTFEFNLYLGGEYIDTFTGTYRTTATLYLFTFTDSEVGWFWSGRYNLRTKLLTGTIAGGRYRGKFQGTLEDDGEPVESKSVIKVRGKSKTQLR